MRLSKDSFIHSNQFRDKKGDSSHVQKIKFLQKRSMAEFPSYPHSGEHFRQQRHFDLRLLPQAYR